MIISLEGNIGSGKDVIVNFFKKNFKDEVMFLDDTIFNWEDNCLLQSFYLQPERWALTLEIHSTLQKIKRLSNVELYNTVHKEKCNITITKRSLMSDRSCFVETFKEMNYMNDKEIDIYNSFFSSFKVPVYDGIIYLRSNVNKCYENIISKQQSVVQFEYIEKLSKNYEKWIDNVKVNEPTIRLLEIDIEKYRDLDGNEMIQEKLLETILDKFPELRTYIKSYSYIKEKKNDIWTVVKKK